MTEFRIPLILLALCLLFPATLAADYQVGGRKQTTLVEHAWGAIYYYPEQMKDSRLALTQRGGFVLESPRGKIEGINRLHGEYDIIYPDGSATIRKRMGATTALFKGRTYSFESGTTDFKVTVADDTIIYQSDINELTVTGRKGVVKYKKDGNQYIITSPAGTTRYKQEMGGAASFEGVPVASHPYRYGFTDFFLENHNVGFIIDFTRLFVFREFPVLFQWDQAITVK